jgi:hypothetical protein
MSFRINSELQLNRVNRHSFVTKTQYVSYDLRTEFEILFGLTSYLKGFDTY